MFRKRARRVRDSESDIEKRVKGADGQMLVDEREVRERCQSPSKSCLMWTMKERQ